MTAKPMGSVFLGDVLRNRFVTTPPSSPPLDALITDSIDAIASSPRTTAAAPRRQSTLTQLLPAASIEPSLPPPEIDPETSLALRILWLEAVLYGPKTASGEGDKKHPALKLGHTLVGDAHDFQTRLDALVAGNDGLRQFIARYEQHASLLTPTFALSGTLPETIGTYDDLSPAELEALLAEMEPDIRAADRDTREIQELEKRGVLGAGKLKDFEGLLPRLDALAQAHEEDVQAASELEKRVAGLVENYSSHVDTLSELFVDWNDSVTMAELRTQKLERAQKERERLGY